MKHFIAKKSITNAINDLRQDNPTKPLLQTEDAKSLRKKIQEIILKNK
jgi:hypothetical protein